MLFSHTLLPPTLSLSLSLISTISFWAASCRTGGHRAVAFFLCDRSTALWIISYDQSLDWTLSGRWIISFDHRWVDSFDHWFDLAGHVQRAGHRQPAGQHARGQLRGPALGCSPGSFWRPRPDHGAVPGQFLLRPRRQGRHGLPRQHLLGRRVGEDHRLLAQPRLRRQAWRGANSLRGE